jgi:hypothetical protein
MTNINQIVSKYLDSNLLIKRIMSLNLINKRALANHIIKEKNIDGNVDAVISAIRRYDSKKYDDIFDKAYEILHDIADISTRTDMVLVTISKEYEILKRIPELFDLIHHERGDLMRVVNANVNIKIILNKKNLPLLKEIIPEDKFLFFEEVAEINIQFNLKAGKGPGPIALLTNELALNEVSIIEMFTCFPEIIYFVFEKDLIKGYEALRQICKS